MNFEIPLLDGNFAHVDSWLLRVFSTNQQRMVFKGTREDQLWLRRRCRQYGWSYKKKRKTLVIYRTNLKIQKPTQFRREDYMYFVSHAHLKT